LHLLKDFLFGLFRFLRLDYLFLVEATLNTFFNVVGDDHMGLLLQERLLLLALQHQQVLQSLLLQLLSLQLH
jgi:hypothetical protein